MFTLDAGSVELRLEVVPVRSLLQHERTLESTIKKLIFEFKNWANLQNPIIVDENHVVLDGNHRAKVFQALEYSYIPVCKIDYFNDSVKLRYWFRHLRHVPSRAHVEEVFHESRCELGLLAGAREIIPELEKDPLKFGFRMGEWFGTGKFPADQVTGAVEVYDALEILQGSLTIGDITLEYIPCQFMNDGEYCSKLTSTDLVIYTPRITKKMIIAAAKEGKVFAPKTTRHIIPARPLNVNVPIHWFNESISLGGINAKFKDHLESKTIKRFGPGQVIDGRYYSEELFVFM